MDFCPFQEYNIFNATLNSQGDDSREETIA